MNAAETGVSPAFSTPTPTHRNPGSVRAVDCSSGSESHRTRGERSRVLRSFRPPVSPFIARSLDLLDWNNGYIGYRTGRT